MIRLIFILPLLCAITTIAQDAPSAPAIDSTKTKFKPDFRPASIRIGTDVLSFVNTYVKDGYSAWEITADTEIHRYLLVADFGYSEESKGDAESSYRNNGNYWRVGIDANFLTRDPDKNAFFIGLHYGQSAYDEHMTINKVDNTFGAVIEDYHNTGMKAGWLELNGGLKVKILQQIWLGYTARFKFGMGEKKGEMLSHSVPGYGIVDKETAWGFNYYIFYRIPFRPTTSILPPKKK